MEQLDAELKALGFGKRETRHEGNNPIEHYRYRFGKGCMPSEEIKKGVRRAVGEYIARIVGEKIANVGFTNTKKGVFVQVRFIPSDEYSLHAHIHKG